MMIEVMIYDLDETLIQTEKLKARSYARADVQLFPVELQEHDVIEAFKHVVGLPRHEVAQQLIAMFDLEERALQFMSVAGVETPRSRSQLECT